MVGVLALDRLNTSAPSESAPIDVRLEPTAQEAFASVSSSARQWQEDARLIGARAHCRGDSIARGGQIEWAFQFFSPSTRRLALFAASGGQVRQIRDRLSPYAVPVLSEDQWETDSDEALDRWLQEGGDYLSTRRSDAQITMRLYTPREGHGRPVWAISGAAPNRESSLVVLVDAFDGAILDR
jgi:hypothetical protein